MAEREPPLPGLLRPHTFERAQVERIWGAVAAERGAQRERGRAPLQGLGVRLALAVALAAGAGVVAVAVRLPRATPGATAAAHSSALSLTRSDGSAFERVEAEGVAPVRVALSDGSALELEPGGLIVPVELSTERVVLRMQRGVARFAVRPGGPRRWVIEAGPACVEVVGTRFVVARGPHGTRVRVEEGKVRVRGAGLPGESVQLTAGEEVTVRAQAVATQEATMSAPTPTPMPTPVATPMPTPEARAPSPAAQLASEPRRAQTMRGATSTSAPAPAPSATATSADAAPAVSVEALLAEADRLRMAREHEAAASVLERVLREHASDPRAALAAFTLGRLRQQALADARGAATAYARALSLGLSGTLAQSARAHLAQTLLASGERASAAAAARDYLARHPRGADATAMRALLLAASAQPAETAR